MKKSLHILGALSFIAQITFAQVGIGTTDPNDLTELHLEDNTRGVVFPRLTNAQRDASLEDNDLATTVGQHPCTTCETVAGVTNISEVKIGTTIFNLDDETYEFWNGVNWTKLNSTTTGAGSSALSEIVAIDGSFNGGTPATISWGNFCNSASNCTGPNPGLRYCTDITGGCVKGEKDGTDRVVIAFFNSVDANGEYARDNRTQDVKDANRFRFYAPTAAAPPTTNLPENSRFYPDSENGTYDITIQFDAVYNTGLGGDLFELEAWLGGDLKSYPLATPSASGDHVYLATPQVNSVAIIDGPIGVAKPLFSDQRVLSKGSINDVFPNISFSIRISSSPLIFANGIVFTIASKSTGAFITITNIAVTATRIR